MNYRVGLLFLSLLVSFSFIGPKLRAEENVLETANLKEIWFDDDQFNIQALAESELSNESYERGSDLDILLHAKFRLINGDLKLAKFYLNRIDDKKSRVQGIKKRYLALIAFIEGRFDQSIVFLSDKHLSDTTLYPQVCLLKLINYMALNDVASLKHEKESCMFYTSKFST